MNSFFIIEFKIFQEKIPGRFRLFRSNIPSVPYSERWIHTKVNHPNPNALVLARPNKIETTGMIVSTWLGDWTYNGNYSVWILEKIIDEKEFSELEEGFKNWKKGAYRGEEGGGYRNE